MRIVRQVTKYETNSEMTPKFNESGFICDEAMTLRCSASVIAAQ
jgi:hypothetical protein